MSLNRSTFFKRAASGAIGTVALCATVSACAGANWSVGINVPGVAFGVAEPAPVYYDQAPVYAPPPPVYYRPAPPVYYRPPPPAFYQSAPTYYGPPAQVYYERDERWRNRHHRWDGDDRGDRD